MTLQKKKGYRKRSRFYVPLFEVPNSDHPLFRLVRKRIKWAKTHDDAKRHSRRFVARIVIGVLVLWGLWTITQIPAVVLSNQTRYWESSLNGIYNLFMFSLLLSYLLDVITIVYTMLSFNTQVDDLLHIALDELQIVWAQYDLARLRTWRIYLIMLSVRIATLLIFCFLLIYTFSMGNIFEGESPIRIFLAAMTIIAISLFLFLEPFWRIKGMTAMGLALAARRKHTTATSMYAFIVVFGSWIFKWSVYAGTSLLFYFVFVVSGLIISFFIDIGDFAIAEDDSLLLTCTYFIFMIFISWYYYQIAQNSSFSAIRDRFK